MTIHKLKRNYGTDPRTKIEKTGPDDVIEIDDQGPFPGEGDDPKESFKTTEPSAGRQRLLTQLAKKNEDASPTWLPISDVSNVWVGGQFGRFLTNPAPAKAPAKAAPPAKDSAPPAKASST